MCVGWAKAARMSALLAPTPVRRAHADRDTARVGTADRGVCARHEGRGRLCPPYELRRLHTIRLDHVSRTARGRPFGAEVGQLGFEAFDVEPQRAAAREGQRDLAG